MIQLLATNLAKKGYYCMRFDFQGNGDSSGDFIDQDLNSWRENISLASEELKASSGVDHLICIGIRMGAVLGLLSQTNCHFSDFILWDPIVDGKQYMNSLSNLQHEVFTQNWHYVIRRKQSELKAGEFLGYQYSEKLIEQIKTCQLKTLLHNKTNVPVQVISTDKKSTPTGLQESGIRINYFSDEGNWEYHKDIERSISTHNINQFIVESLSQ
jgi:esterase/lipase